MSINIIVYLDEKNDKLKMTNRNLDVEKNKTGIQNQRITWWLFGKLGNGAFLPTTGPLPGFEWDDPAAAKPFFKIIGVDHDGRSLSIDDTNKPGAKEQQWSYLLRVFYDGKFYESVFSKKRPLKIRKKLLADHPIIINR